MSNNLRKIGVIRAEFLPVDCRPFYKLAELILNSHIMLCRLQIHWEAGGIIFLIQVKMLKRSMRAHFKDFHEWCRFFVDLQDM